MNGGGRSNRRWITIAAAAAVLTVSVIAFARARTSATAANQTVVRDGRLTVASTPAGAQVSIDGVARGVTPLITALAPGAYSVSLQHDSDTRSVQLLVTPGAEIAQYFEFSQRPVVTSSGKLSVTSDPSGIDVRVDGRARGETPLSIADLPAGRHTVVFETDNGKVERGVTVDPGATASVMFAEGRSTVAAAGWLTVLSPFDIQVYENDELVGAGGPKRWKIMLGSGRHQLRLVNTSLNYDESRRMEIPAGKTVTTTVDAPKVMVSANAKPWAELLIDGAVIGQTPLANIAVAVGAHQIVFRHPQLGERRQSVVITAKGPNRISADFTNHDGQP